MLNIIDSNTSDRPEPDDRVLLRALAVSRILIGVLWLSSLRWKLPPDFRPDSGRGLREWLDLEVEHAAFERYGDLISSLVIPNFTVFAWLLFVTELSVGLSLLTGTWTRLGALVGLLMSINLGIGLLEVPGEWVWSYLMLAMWHAIFLIGAAVRVWGVDGWLRSRGAASSWQRRLT